MPTERWHYPLVIGSGAAGLYLLIDFPLLNLAIITVAGFAAAAICAVAPRRLGVAHRAPWTLISVAIFLFIVGILMRPFAEAQTGAASGFVDLFTLPGYVCLTVAFLTMLRRHWRAQESAHAYLDAIMVLIGAGSLALAVFAVPASLNPERPAWLSIVAGLYPLFDVGFILAQVTMSFTTAVRLRSWKLLTIAVSAMLVADVGYAWVATYGHVTGNRLFDLPFLVALTTAAAAAMHPSVRDFNAVRQTASQPWSAPRLVLMSAAVVLPAIGLLVARPTLVLERAILAVGCAGVALTLLVRAVSAVNAQARIQRALEHRVTHDPLTGLGNRELLERELSLRLNSTRAPAESVSLLYVDVDGFKFVNDSYGHAVGDELLTQAASRLARAVAPSDAVATRVGGDEFAVVAADDRDGTVGEWLAAEIVAAFSWPLGLSVGKFDATVSVGVANSGSRPHPPRPAELLREADAAMYEAKSSGRGSWARFDERTEHDSRHRMSLEFELRQAVERSQFQVQYQPVVDLLTRQVVGAEALVRWEHPKLGTVPPAAFLAVADEFGLIGRITEFVIGEAVARMASEPDLRVSVNVAASHLHDENFPSRVAELLHRFDVAPNRLGIEISESALASGHQTVRAAVDALGQLGTPLVIDDFGTGTGSLTALRLAPAHQLKIDRDFVARLGRPGTDQAIRAAVAVAATYGISVVAKGVETMEQQRQLRQCGVTLGQGWLFGRPATVASSRSTAKASSRISAR